MTTPQLTTPQMSSWVCHFRWQLQTPDDNTPMNKTPDDNTPMNKTPDDNTPDDSTPDDNTPDDNTPDDNTPDDNTPDDNTPVVILGVVIWSVVIWSVVVWGFVLWGVVIWCCRLKLSSEVTQSPFYLFIENFIHSFLIVLFIMNVFTNV
jgi:hypothetical protein